MLGTTGGSKLHTTAGATTEMAYRDQTDDGTNSVLQIRTHHWGCCVYTKTHVVTRQVLIAYVIKRLIIMSVLCASSSQVVRTLHSYM